MREIVIGSRGSRLALAQAHLVAEQIKKSNPAVHVVVRRIKTLGDELKDAPLHSLETTGVFVKQVEQLLLEAKVDLAVHSYKDLPVEKPPGLRVAAVPPRGDPRDVLVAVDNRTLEDLPNGARIGTGSLRRRAQLRHIRKDLIFADIRGNVPTRLKKLEESKLEAVVLAAAGLERLGLAGRITQIFPVKIIVPAVGQGALAVEVREDDEELTELVGPINDPDTSAAVLAERSCLRALGGGCHLPMGAYAYINEDKLEMLGVVSDTQGERLVRLTFSWPKDDPEAAGKALAQQLLDSGAKDILGEFEAEGAAE